MMMYCKLIVNFIALLYVLRFIMFANPAFRLQYHNNTDDMIEGRRPKLIYCSVKAEWL